MSHLKLLLSASAGLATVLGAGLAMAAEPATQAQAAQQTMVGEVIVTAQKRVQRLQDVPVVVTALNQQQLQDAGVRDIKDLTALTPGLTVTSTGSEASTTARIRGVGTVSDNIGLEDSVGVYIDGVYRPRNGVAFNDLGELSDVEVLKGPQGTLFGKNTTAGVIQITSMRPQFTFGAQGEATFSNYSGYGGSVSVTGPIVGDQLAGRIYLADRQRDGYYSVISPPGSSLSRQNDEHLFTVRGQLLFKPNADFDINFIADYTKRDDHCCSSVPIISGPAAGVLNYIDPTATANPANPKNYTIYANRNTIEHITDSGISAEAHWRTPWLNSATLTSITAYRDWRNSGGGDTDATGLDLLYAPTSASNEFKQFTQELRYAGNTDRLDWMVGAFYSHEDLYQHAMLAWGSDYATYGELLTYAFSGGLLSPANFYIPVAGAPGGPFPVGQGEDDHYHQVEQSESLFTQETFKLTDKLELTGGLRYTWEHKTDDSLYNNTDGGATCATGLTYLAANPTFADPFAALYCVMNPYFNNLPDHQSSSETALTGTAKLAYKFSRDFMTYASYSRGYLVGGFNLDRYTTGQNTTLTPTLNTGFSPEYVDAYEIGEKSALFDRSVILDAAIFYQKYTDFQLNQFNGLRFVVTSIPQVISQGAEADLTWRVTHELTANFGMTYADSYYPKSAANLAVLGTPSSTPGVLCNPPTSTVCRLPGTRMSLDPLWSLTAAVSYDHPIGGYLALHMAADVKYNSKMNTGSDLDPAKTQPGYTVVNARLGLGAQNGRWEADVWAQNLFNQYYVQVAYNGVLQTFGPPSAYNSYYGFLGAPRMYGVTLRVKY